MLAKDLKELLHYVNDYTEVVVGCEGYSNYDFKNKCYHDGEDGQIKLTMVQNVLVIHPQNNDPFNYE